MFIQQFNSKKMSNIIISCSVYMALVYEASFAFVIMVQMVHFSKIMKFDMVDVMILIGEMCKLMCFGILAVGVISRHRLMLKLWLILSYVQIKWGDVGEVFFTLYEYLFTEKYTGKEEELTQKLSLTHGPVIGLVLTRIGVTLMVYAFYTTVEPLQIKPKAKLDQKAAELKVNKIM